MCTSQKPREQGRQGREAEKVSTRKSLCINCASPSGSMLLTQFPHLNAGSNCPCGMGHYETKGSKALRHVAGHTFALPHQPMSQPRLGQRERGSVCSGRPGTLARIMMDSGLAASSSRTHSSKVSILADSQTVAPRNRELVPRCLVGDPWQVRARSGVPGVGAGGDSVGSRFESGSH